MKTQIKKLAISTLILASSLAANAGSRLCYVQAKGNDGVYKDALATVTISSNDHSGHILLDEVIKGQNERQMYLAQIQEDGLVMVSTYKVLDYNDTLIMAASKGDEGVTLINEPLKRLIGCSAITK